MYKFLINIIILFMGSFIALTYARADQEAVQGRVASIDRSAGTLSLTLFQAGHHGSKEKEKHRGHKGWDRHRYEDRILSVIFVPDTLPDFVVKGSLVRIRGEWDREMNDRFRILEILPFRGTANDPTGVRERLMHHH